MRVFERILAIKLRSLGDTVLLTAPLTALRSAFPKAEIHVAVADAWADLLVGHPGADQVIPVSLPVSKPVKAWVVADLARRFRRTRYDCAIAFHASPSSAWMARLSGARTRSVHFHGHSDSNRFSTVTVPGKGALKSIIERDLDALRALGARIDAPVLPSLHLSAAELEWAGARIEGYGLGAAPILALGLGASRETKRWPMERWASLASQWIQATGGAAMAVVGEEEAELARAIRQAIDSLSPPASVRRKVVVESALPLRRLAAMLARSRVFAGNDSGPRHVAAALGVPTVTLFGPEHPFEWHPYDATRHRALFLDGLSCRTSGHEGYPAWCGLDRCVDEGHRCLKSVGVNQVLEACLAA